MKIVVFGPNKRTGALRNGKVVDLSHTFAKYLRECTNESPAPGLAEHLVPSELARLIEAGPAALDNARRALEYLDTQAQDHFGVDREPLEYALSEVSLHAPHPKGGRVACAGSNFVTHRQRMARRVGREEREPFIWGFWKVADDTLGPEGEVIYPRRCDRLDYEGEVAIILGKRGKDLHPGDLKDFLWGVTLCCDWSIRSPREVLGPMNFAPAKNFDTSLSLGPCIVVGEFDPGDIDFETVVNGERRQSNNTREMIFSFAQYLEYLSRDLTLRPGDIICSGTGQGTVADASPTLENGTQAEQLFLQPGDIVEIRSPLIGSLRAHIASKPDGQIMAHFHRP
jgi:2-keto-4-pentenoate hydratase/2-oxohepta-3-ene-1,7-dioic acid hydratase in catechol pathway